METRRSAGFPADLLVLLMLPTYAIFAVAFGPQRTWLLLLLLGLLQLSVAISVLRRRRSSVAGWLALAIGIMAFSAGVRIALSPW
jgi:hypothetical protein